MLDCSSCQAPSSQYQRNCSKIRTYSSLWSSRVIDFGANRKRICTFL